MLLVLILAFRLPPPNLRAAASGPWWLWTGGLVGAAFVFGALFVAPRIGAAAFAAATIFGTVAASLIIDHFGLFGFPVKPMSLLRLAGTGCVLARRVPAPSEPGVRTTSNPAAHMTSTTSPASRTTVFQARKIITMNPMQPAATHVAVRDGRVLAVGDLDRMKEWGAFELDGRFADKVLMPGLVEGHSHLMAGGLWQFPFVGFHARTAPDGTVWPGCSNFEEVVQRLVELEAKMSEPGKPLVAWGFDPIFFGTERMTRRHLDRVSATRPVVILHASQHLMNVNSAALPQAGITRDTEIEGVVKDASGEPSGELQEFAAMFPISRLIGNTSRGGRAARPAFACSARSRNWPA